jgi:hypothetical protein
MDQQAARERLETVDEQLRSAGTLEQRRERVGALPVSHALHLAIAWTILLLALILAPSRVIPDEKTFSIRKYIPWFDLWVHLTLFGGFALTWIRAVASPLRWAAVPAAGLILAVGTEWAQSLPFIQRDPNLLDGIADAAGLVAGLVAAVVVDRCSTDQRPD